MWLGPKRAVCLALELLNESIMKWLCCEKILRIEPELRVRREDRESWSVPEEGVFAMSWCISYRERPITYLRAELGWHPLAFGVFPWNMKEFQNSIMQSGPSLPPQAVTHVPWSFSLKNSRAHKVKKKERGPSTLHLFLPLPWSLRCWSFKWGLGILNQVLLCKFNEMQTNT